MRPWSKSKLDVATSCSLRFHHQYVAKTQGARVAKGEGRVGRAAHRALEALLKGKDTPLSELLDTYAVDEELTSVETENLLCLRDQIAAYPPRFDAWAKKRGLTRSNVFVERRLAIREDFSSTRFWDNDTGMYRGVVDLMVRLPVPGGGIHVVIIDHKTGKSMKMDHHEDQMRSYAVLADSTFKDVRMVSLGMHFLRHQEVKFLDPVSVDVIRNEYRPWLLKKVQDTEALVEARTSVEPTLGWGCDYCSHQHLCPAK